MMKGAKGPQDSVGFFINACYKSTDQMKIARVISEVAVMEAGKK